MHLRIVGVIFYAAGFSAAFRLRRLRSPSADDIRFSRRPREVGARFDVDYRVRGCYTFSMRCGFGDITDNWEREDEEQMRERARFIAAVRREFANADELIRAASKNGGDPSASAIPDVLPVRTEKVLRMRKHTRSQKPYMHTHDFYELIYCRAGKCGQTFSDGARMELSAGEACLIPPAQAHSLDAAARGDVVLKAHIPAALFERLSPKRPSRATAYAVSEAFDRAFVRLVSECEASRPYAEYAREHLLGYALAELFRGTENNGGTAVRRALAEYLAEGGNSDLKGFAERLGYSAAYTAKLVRTSTGSSFSDNARARRFDRAARLLEETDMPVEAIAAECGYASAAGLYKLFAREGGCTPGEWRAKARKG